MQPIILTSEILLKEQVEVWKYTIGNTLFYTTEVVTYLSQKKNILDPCDNSLECGMRHRVKCLSNIKEDRADWLAKFHALQPIINYSSKSSS